MQKKQKQGITPFTNFTSLTAGLLLLLCLPLNVKANHGGAACYKLGTLTIVSTGAVAPTTKPYPYLRFIKWLTPTTHPSCIHGQINLTPGTIFDAKTLLSIKKRLMALPYFSTVSITRKVVDPTDEIMLSDLIIETKDRFPITFDVNLDRGALFTITHHNAWGRGHSLSQQLFLKKRWGYGLAYELPKLDGNYFFGGACYTQTGDGYRFKYQNLWVSKSFKMQTEDPYAPYYWVAGLSGSKKNFVTPTPIIYLDNSPYHSHTFLLGKVGWVADSYETMRGIYTLNALEQLPKGGAVEMFYGYQKRQSNNRHYIGLNGIKNIANTALRHLHISCESSAFVHKKRLEEGILKLALAYAGPPIQSCNGARQFVAIDYIVGWRMPKERMLGITQRDPEALEEPSDENSLPLPIGARLNVHLDSTLHRPIVTNLIRFVFLGFTNFIALYSKNHQLLNQTWVDSCGIGLQLEHITKPWPTLTLKVGHSALLGRVIPSVQLSTGHFKNKTEAKPTLVDYS